VSKTVDNSLFAYSPPATGTTAYGAANALNQYPTVGGYAYTYQPDGGLKETDTFEANYDELGKATVTYLTPTPGTVDPNNYDIQGIDALDHVYFHYRVPSAGATYPFVYHWTDGLRPETIQDPLCQQTQQTPQTAPVCTGTGLGNKTYVLGPDPDERWAMIGINGGTYNPHTDRAGTLIALSNGGNVSTIYAYDAYDQNASAANDASTGPAGYLYRYTGLRLDPNTGLYDDKARDYSPKLGRFIQPDPAGLDQGPNLYAYVGNDPVNAADPSGMCNTHGGCYGDSGAVETGLPAPGDSDTTVVSGAVPGSGTELSGAAGSPSSGAMAVAHPSGGHLMLTAGPEEDEPNRGLLEEFLDPDPTEGLREARYSNAVNALSELRPGASGIQTNGPPSWTAVHVVEEELANAREGLAAAIVRHAFSNHASEFSIAEENAFAQLAIRTMSTQPGRAMIGEPGRVLFYDSASQAAVIVNTQAPEQSTMFRTSQRYVNRQLLP
jgi:RHS repeat-associated protein